MDINNIQGMNAYTAYSVSADTTSVRNNNTQAVGAEFNKQTAPADQEAFQVNITQEALSLQTENTEEPAQEDMKQQLTQQVQQTQQFQGQQGSQLDIFA